MFQDFRGGWGITPGTGKVTSPRDRREHAQGGALAQPHGWVLVAIPGGLHQRLENAIPKRRRRVVKLAVTGGQPDGSAHQPACLGNRRFRRREATRRRPAGTMEVPKGGEGLDGLKQGGPDPGHDFEGGLHAADDLGKSVSIGTGSKKVSR